MHPYVNERPASTASFSGGIGDRTTTTTRKTRNDYMIIDFSSVHRLRFSLDGPTHATTPPALGMVDLA